VHKISVPLYVYHCLSLTASYSDTVNNDNRNNDKHYFARVVVSVSQQKSAVKYANKKHLKNVGPIHHCEPPHALILHCHSPGVATVACRLRIDVHDNNDNA